MPETDQPYQFKEKPVAKSSTNVMIHKMGFFVCPKCGCAENKPKAGCACTCHQEKTI